jgi:predicted MPP superfamily phosphohydrolase
MQMILFGIVATVVWGGVHFYVGHRLIVGSHLVRPWSLVAWSLVAAHASLSPLVFIVRRGAPDSVLLEILQWVTYVGMGFFVLLLTLVLMRDLAFMVARIAGWFDPSDPFPEDPTRRTILTSGLNLGIFASSGVATGVGYVAARRRPTVDEVELRVPDLPADLDGFRIIQVSDMHIGPTLKRAFVETVVEVVNELDADIVAMTGDLVDGYVADLRDELQPLRSMRSRHGAYYVTGNHEYYWDAHGWQREVETLGMRSLANAHHPIGVGEATLLVGGVNDLHAERFFPDEASNPAAAMEGAPRHDFSVLLAHQPKSCYEAAPAGWNLQLSGHTHGGQFYPWNFFVGLAHPFTAGLDMWERMWVYVNRGTGYWGPPLRLGVPSEITALTLRSG